MPPSAAAESAFAVRGQHRARPTDAPHQARNKWYVGKLGKVHCESGQGWNVAPRPARRGGPLARQPLTLASVCADRSAAVSAAKPSGLTLGAQSGHCRHYKHCIWDLLE